MGACNLVKIHSSSRWLVTACRSTCHVLFDVVVACRELLLSRYVYVYVHGGEWGVRGHFSERVMWLFLIF